jgi:multidrug efflux pump subunit AcrA (membrane-fusion protein)
LAYQLSKAEWERLQSQLAQTRNRLQAEQSRAEAQLRIQASEQGNYQVLSDTDGMLFEIYRKEGELVRKGEPIAMLGSADNCYLQLSIDELDIAKIKIGQEVLVAIDIYPDQFFKANIAKIYPLMNAKEQAFRVDAQFQAPFKPSFAGLNVEANIIIQQKEKALTIPKRLVSNDSVWVLDADGQPQRTAIKKGLENMELVEIVSGLSENSQLVEGQ